MPRNATTGAYAALPSSVNPAVDGAIISAADFNGLRDDLSAALNHTAATTRALYPTAGQVQDGALTWGGVAGGSANALTIAPTPAITGYAAGQVFRFVAASANTGAATLSANGLPGLALNKGTGAEPLERGDIQAGQIVTAIHDGTRFVLQAPASREGTGYRNRLHNGCFRVAQQFGYAARTPAAAGPVVDRWRLTTSNSRIGVEVVDAPAGFVGAAKAIRLTPAAAYAAGSAEAFGLGQRIEGFDVADFGMGAANPASIGLSFWALSALGGTYCVAFRNGDATRSRVLTYTLAAGVPALVRIALPGNSDGAWAKDNAAGLDVFFDLGSGSSLQTATANTWQAANLVRVSGTSNFMRAGEALTIGSVQLERLDTPAAPFAPFERRPLGAEMALCTRYLQRYTGTHSLYANTGGADLFWMLPLPTQMRAAPSASFLMSGGFNWSSGAVAATNVSAATFKVISTTGGLLSFNVEILLEANP